MSPIAIHSLKLDRLSGESRKTGVEEKEPDFSFAREQGAQRVLLISMRVGCSGSFGFARATEMW